MVFSFNYWFSGAFLRLAFYMIEVGDFLLFCDRVNGRLRKLYLTKVLCSTNVYVKLKVQWSDCPGIIRGDEFYAGLLGIKRKITSGLVRHVKKLE